MVKVTNLQGFIKQVQDEVNLEEGQVNRNLVVEIVENRLMGNEDGEECKSEYVEGIVTESSQDLEDLINDLVSRIKF